MILFLEDWANYPDAIVDTKTPNRSFVRLAGLYKKMGVKNHAFLLALHNPDLQGVDPHSPDLTMTQITAIIVECTVNKWYFFREVVRAPAQSGIGSTPFLANRGNIALIWSFFNHITSLLIQPRQTGKSFSTDTIMVGLLNIWQFNATINLLTKDDTLRTSNVMRIREIAKCLPPYLQRHDIKNDSRGGEKITIKSLSNNYIGHVAQASKKAAVKAARGLTSPIFQVDEIAYYTHIGVALPAALPASSAAQDAAKRNGTPYGIIFTTTAGWLDSESGKYTYDMYRDGTKWTEKLLDSKNQQQLEFIIIKNSQADEKLVVIDMNHRQLGYTDQWLKEKIKNARSTGKDAETDFLNIWCSGSEESPFDTEILSKMTKSVREDFTSDITSYGYILRWYCPEDVVEPMKYFKDVHLVMGLDTSDAIGNDDIAMVIRRADNGEVVCVGQFNETNTIMFSRWLLTIFVDLPLMTAIIERRSTAIVIMDYLITLMLEKGMEPYRRMFNWVVDGNRTLANDLFKHAPGSLGRSRFPSIEKLRKEVGYATSSGGRSSRDNLYGLAMQQALLYTGTITHDKTLISQVSTLTMKNNRIDHSTGNKDDLVIAWLMSYWFLTMANNTDLYGIPIGLSLSMMDIREGDTEAARVANAKQKLSKSRINFLMSELKAGPTMIREQMILSAIEREQLNIEESDDIHLNITNLVNDIQLLNRKKKAKRKGIMVGMR